MSVVKNIYKKYFFKLTWVQLVHAIFFSPGFRREIISVFSGIIRHREGAGLLFKLRRNIHRLEKGLIMEPRRSIFALDYIKETVDIYKIINTHKCCDRNELKWFNNVLEEYFSVTGEHAIIKQCELFFLSSKFDEEDNIPKSIPKMRQEYERAKISYDEFHALCCQRRSVRWYEGKKVPRMLIDKAIVAASQSPSACNRQPFKFYIFDDPELVSEVSNIPGGTVGFTHQFPVIIVVVGDLSAYEYDRDRHLIYIDGSLAAMTFMLALETLGLSSCPINWSGVEKLEIQMDRALQLKSHEKPVMLISVGYAKERSKIPYSHKKSLNSLRTFNLHD